MVMVVPGVALDIAPPLPTPALNIAPPSEHSSVLVLPSPGMQGDPGTPGSPGAGVIIRQEVPQSVIPLQHNLGRDGPVSVVGYSLDRAYEYDGYHIQWVDENLCLFVSDTPVSGIFLVL